MTKYLTAEETTEAFHHIGCGEIPNGKILERLEAQAKDAPVLKEEMEIWKSENNAKVELVLDVKADLVTANLAKEEAEVRLKEVMGLFENLDKEIKYGRHMNIIDEAIVKHERILVEKIQTSLAEMEKEWGNNG